MTKNSCWRHPAKSVVGVCASCLQERLLELASAQDRYVSPQRRSFDSNASPPVNDGGDGDEVRPRNNNASTASDAAAAAAAAGTAGLVTVSTLMEADQVEADFRKNNGFHHLGHHQQPVNSKSRGGHDRRTSVLQRTHSWSHHSSRNAAADLGKAAKILKDRQFYGEGTESGLGLGFEPIKGFQFGGETPKGHIKASSWPEMVPVKHGQGQQQHWKASSWLRSLFGMKKSKEPASATRVAEHKPRKGLFGGLGKRKSKASTMNVNDVFEDALSSPWTTHSGKIDSEDFDDEFHRQITRPRYPRNETNRVTPLSGNSEVLCGNGTSGEHSYGSRLSKMSSVNGRHCGSSRTPAVRDGWSKALSTPLRVFRHKQPVKKSEVDVEPEDEKRTWSPKRFHPSPAFPTSASYTTYYRDYGASWSLHSSPMPGKGRQGHHPHHRGSRPWENRDAAFHAHSSPFHATGSNTWNFYLTPVRPVRATASRHRL